MKKRRKTNKTTSVGALPKSVGFSSNVSNAEIEFYCKKCGRYCHYIVFSHLITNVCEKCSEAKVWHAISYSELVERFTKDLKK